MEQESWRVADAWLVKEARAYSDLPPPILAEVAFGGRSNVGKSSLINALIGRKLMRTSASPGATRGLIYVRVRLKETLKQNVAEMGFVDLPGYGFAKRSKAERLSWGAMVENYIAYRVSLRALVVLIDIRRGVEEDDEQLFDFLNFHQKALVVVLTKADKVSSRERERLIAGTRKRLDAIEKRTNRQIEVVPTSAKTGEGIEALWKAIRRHSNIGLACGSGLADFKALG
ncbi:MAG: ribosome biogenesis GTP-binding protein YihA/YsxC [Deltaproteobacteria bacterium]|nr:ribosome biogenesis GTP-binding protein YihA/YsxC [Deltaproteobacteria bacterium]